MNFPAELKYTESHEWVKVEGNTAYIGITDFAQSELGDIVFVEMPEEGDEISKGDAFGTIEAVKAASDLNAPVSGKVLEINEDLESEPELVNKSPYEEGWIVKIELSDESELDSLLSAEEYEKAAKK